MHTRKKVLAKNSSKEQACHKSCRQQKKTNTSAETKVTELITSSARKPKNVEVRPRKIRDTQGAMNLDDCYDLPQDETEDICMTIKSSFSHEASEERSAPSVPETIFSRGFHFPKDVCGDIVGKRDFTVVFSKDQSVCGEHVVEDMQIDAFNFCRTIESQLNSVDNGTEVTSYAFVEKTDSFSGNTNTSSSGEYSVLENLSPEVSEIYLAMQHSKLECIDEPSHESVSTDGCDMDAEDDFDAFDPYLFIKNLPDLSAVVPTFRPTLLPRQTRSCPSTTLVLDLDETLVHSMLEPCDDADFTFPVDFNFTTHTVYVRCRPYLKDFLERVSSLFEIIIFTASQGIYAERLLNVLDPKRRLFRHRIYRESCVFVEGNYLKDLSVLGRDLAHVAIIDNSPQAFGYQIDNGIPIESWFDDRMDQELLSLLPFLESLIGVVDVRPLIAQKFNLREKISSAA